MALTRGNRYGGITALVQCFHIRPSAAQRLSYRCSLCCSLEPCGEVERRRCVGIICYLVEDIALSVWVRPRTQQEIDDFTALGLIADCPEERRTPTGCVWVGGQLQHAVHFGGIGRCARICKRLPCLLALIEC